MAENNNTKKYHGCFYRNRNGTRKLINSKHGEKCVVPTTYPYWKKDIKEKYLIKPEAQTRLYAEKKNTRIWIQ